MSDTMRLGCNFTSDPFPAGIYGMPFPLPLGSPPGVARTGLKVVGVLSCPQGIALGLSLTNRTSGCLAGEVGPQIQLLLTRTRSGCWIRTGRLSGAIILALAVRGITPVESSGTITRTAAMIVSTVKAVAMGQRLRLRPVGEDSSRVSANILVYLR